MSQPEGKIFIAAERGHTETDWFRSYATFNAGPYQNEHKKPFGPLYVLNDETLSGGRAIELFAEDASMVMVVPLVGSIDTGSKDGEQTFVEAGQAQLLFQPVGSSLHIGNPSADKLVNYVHIWVKAEAPPQHATGTFSFSIEEQNKLVDLFAPVQQEDFYLRAVIGKLNGRNETTYTLHSTENGVMAFVLQGAFEVENRLLEGRDGLALWDTERIGLEALSNEAIILLIEIKLVHLRLAPEGSFLFDFA